ncbi:class I SAM-dependent methyltransferase [Actinocorallia longicatena]|uniref:Methyltransferase family protein n=1 Tax=Actinocorallia longicatena TaxID=111803 RepID=A0ABP6Q0E2_9ACTN
MKRVLGLVAAGLVLDAVRLRRRALRLNGLVPGELPPEESASAYLLVGRAGLRISDEVRAAAIAHAAGHGLDVLELIPSSLDTARALELVRRLDPAGYRSDRAARGVSGGHAIVVSADLLRRAEVSRWSDLDADELDALSVKLKKYSSTGTDVVVVDALGVRGCPPEQRRAILRRRYHNDLPVQQAAMLTAMAAFGAAALRSPRMGAVALAAAAVHPLIATAGTRLAPRDLARFALLRPVGAPCRVLGTVVAAEAEDPAEEKARAAYLADIERGTDRFFEEPRTDCPWCSSTALTRLLTSRDYQQRKPGVFTVDRCASCGHVFQNPRLNLDGLDFYYRDYYDGLGEPEVERGFRLSGGHYRQRAEMLRGHTTPRSWLDVGGGHGHFCNAARDSWPETTFDVLDMNGTSIAEAERQGWVDTAHHGLFPELASGLTGRYDVVSMHHYLEHTLDPALELDAAAAVLPPGGHLLIEVPDPESPFARAVGRWWHNWFQPQHLHFVPLNNLTEALEARGFTILEVHRGPAHQQLDLLMVVLLMLNRVLPSPRSPWRTPRHPRLAWTARIAGYLAAAPLIAAATAADHALHPLIRRYGGANTYRVLARKA